MYCAKCGLQVYPEEKFCAGCGTPLTKETFVQKNGMNSKIFIFFSISIILLGLITFIIIKSNSSSKQGVPNKIMVNPIEKSFKSQPLIQPKEDSEQPIRISSIPGQKPRRIRDIRPVYPQEALDARIQGVVIIEAMLDIYGRVRQARVISGHPLLNEAAMNAIKQWIYMSHIS